MRCAICLRDFDQLRFDTGRIRICGTCVNSLNNYHAVAEEGYQVLGERLHFGMRRRALAEANDPSQPERAARARHTLDSMAHAQAAALPNWLNNAAGDPNWRRREHKLVRAHRRGLLHYDRPHNWGYPTNWAAIASNIRLADHFQCVLCGAQNVELDVHHIVYLSNFGTHRQENLISLCRCCHEEEHGHALDFGEQADGAPALTPTPPAAVQVVQPVHVAEADLRDWGEWAKLEAAPPLVASHPRLESPVHSPPVQAPPAGAAVPPSPPAPPLAAVKFTQDPGLGFWKRVLSLPVILILIALAVVMTVGHKKRLEHYYGALPPAAPVFTVATIAPPAPARSANHRPDSLDAMAPVSAKSFLADEERRWSGDVASFMQSRCELLVHDESVRSQVQNNVAILQQALNDVAQPGMTNRELLEAAGERVYAYPQYTPRGYCSGTPPVPTVKVGMERAAAPSARAPKQKCRYAGVMSDEEIAACR